MDRISTTNLTIKEPSVVVSELNYYYVFGEVFFVFMSIPSTLLGVILAFLVTQPLTKLLESDNCRI